MREPDVEKPSSRIPVPSAPDDDDDDDEVPSLNKKVILMIFVSDEVTITFAMRFSSSEFGSSKPTRKGDPLRWPTKVLYYRGNILVLKDTIRDVAYEPGAWISAVGYVHCGALAYGYYMMFHVVLI